MKSFSTGQIVVSSFSRLIFFREGSMDGFVLDDSIGSRLFLVSNWRVLFTDCGSWPGEIGRVVDPEGRRFASAPGHGTARPGGQPETGRPQKAQRRRRGRFSTAFFIQVIWGISTFVFRFFLFQIIPTRSETDRLNLTGATDEAAGGEPHGNQVQGTGTGGAALAVQARWGGLVPGAERLPLRGQSPAPGARGNFLFCFWNQMSSLGPRSTGSFYFLFFLEGEPAGRNRVHLPQPVAVRNVWNECAGTIAQDRCPGRFLSRRNSKLGKLLIVLGNWAKTMENRAKGVHSAEQLSKTQ